MQIFGYLSPLDFLYLARTSKDLRRFLFSKSNVPLWDKALKQEEGLPSCPEYLSVPAFASLIYETRCHVCSVFSLCSRVLSMSACYRGASSRVSSRFCGSSACDIALSARNQCVLLSTMVVHMTNYPKGSNRTMIQSLSSTKYPLQTARMWCAPWTCISVTFQVEYLYHAE